ncbi:ATP-dependent DNA helicase [Pedobacter cryophilus]|uniref:DNA 3'-5' helicase n=1 Tax=Pedobacter cryophilus TaxID=2571271 RepID=A0A4U1C680_9SPHI|nr:ATP-dependent DNA helicase [Pedobacter cryophilus]TKC00953.1 ATP-dependent helicase [Pedobacter cryophilus]
MQNHLAKYNQNFLAALERLNPNQLKAVNQTEGPVLVIAGPGTGKTQILAARIGNILLKTDTLPHNILCLTYTDAGAVAMRKRLFDFIGPEAYRVNIYTFHAFCNDIIQENLDYFGKLELDAISDLERMELFRKLVDSFDKDHPLKRFRGDVYYEVGRLQNLFSVMKKEDWSADFITTKIDEFLQLIEFSEPDSPYYATYKYAKKYKDKNPGDFKTGFADLQENMQKLKAAVAEFPKYQQMMRDASRYDFDDMIIWVLEAFKKDDQFLLNYQERFQYILVDEYQDTSGSQNQLINFLISYWDQPNIFVVGDDDQSIFRFQGANIQNIEAYNLRYAEDLYRIMLTDNYRSTQPILDISRVLIENNTERIQLPGLNKHLLAKNLALAELKIAPEINAYETQFHEFAAITNEIENLVKDGVPAEEIAIIYKEHKAGEELARYFKVKGIPVNTKRRVNILKEPFGKKIINILRYLAFESEFSYSGDELLFQIMHYDFYQIAPMDVAKISVEVNAFNRSSRNEKTSLRRKIHEIAAKPQQSLFDSESTQQIKRLSDDLEFWIKEVRNLTLQGLFEKIMVRGGILAYVLKSPEKTWLMQVLSSVFNFLKDESRKQPDIHLKEFVTLIDLLESNDLSLDLHQNIFNEKGVNFLTCHGSKGLEFEYVFFIGATTNVWEKKRKNTSGQFKLPDTVFSAQSGSSDIEELRRLFYVALTRAKKHLRISFPEMDTKGKLLEPTVFIGEILAATDLQIAKTAVAEEQLTDFFILQFTSDEKPNLGLIDYDYVKHLLESYALSVTHLNNYLDCPLKFYFQNLIQVPSGKSDTLTFGSAVHWALNKLFRSLADNNQQFHGLPQFLSDFKWYMQRNREAFTDEQFKRRSDYGDKILPEYYNKYINSWEKITATEYAIKNVEMDGVPIKGIIDKLEFKGRQTNVVDYKTGSYDNAKSKFGAPDDRNPLGGDYWRQAVFYKILVDSDARKDWEVISTEFDFIEPVKNEYKKHPIIITPEAYSIVKTQIKETYAKIKNMEFTQGCGKADCHWCGFVKSNFASADGIMGEMKDGDLDN